MALNTTNAERTRQLAIDLAAKLVLERQFRIDITRFLKDLNTDNRSQFVSTGQTINASQYKTELQGILIKHYRRAKKRFGSQIRRGLKQLNEDIDIAQTEFLQEQTDLRADLILDTAQSDLNAAISQVINEDPTLSQEVVGATAAALYAQKIPGKANTIAMAETQNAAEGIKAIEASFVIGQPDVNGRKQWRTVLDERTRPAHARADRQVQNVGEPYIVGGELLSRPGDSSLGASASNTINCRCSSIIIIE